MSTNKSQNLNLHLWEPEDDFLRTEFNENFTAVDSAVKSAQTAAVNAQQTADKALLLPYATGSYTGNGTSVEIDLGFRPSFLIVVSMRSGIGMGQDYEWIGFFGITGGTSLSNQLILTDTGFCGLKINGYPSLSENGRVYEYIAFR